MNKINYNDISRYVLDKKIELPLFNYFEELTNIDWEYYQELIIDNWLNTNNSSTGISVPSINSKINRIASKINDPGLNEQDRERLKKKFRAGNNLKSGKFSFKDLKIFLNFTDPIEILITIFKKDLKKNIILSNIQDINKSASYLNSKRAEQYHPESSQIYYEVPFNETDLRQILTKGFDMFRLIGNPAAAGELEFYLSDITEIRNEWQTSSELVESKKVFSNLPKRKHIGWGFVGYEDEQEKLISKLSKGNQLLFQIVGQGGSGKSALANEVCHQIFLKYNTQIKFDSFIWITSKSDILDNAEIKNIGKASRYKNYKDLLSQLFLALNEENVVNFEEFNDFEEKNLELEIVNYLNGNDGIKRLIVIDNLENISKENQERITDFLEDNVSKPNYVILTTRHRILELPSINIEIGGLGKKHGIDLFNKLIEYYQVEFKMTSKRDREDVENYVKLANYYPLAIKYCIEKTKKENCSLRSSFEICKEGSSELHRFIFRDTYSTLSGDEKRTLKTIVLYKTSLNHDIDKHVLRKIANTAYKNINVEDTLNTLYRNTLVTYVGLSDDDIQVVLTDLVASHIEDIIMRHEMDTTKIHNSIKAFIITQKISANSDTFQIDMRTSNIQKNKFQEALKYLSNKLRLVSIIEEIKSYSSSFYGLGYLEANLDQIELKLTNSVLKKRVNDNYLRSMRLKPEQSIFWKDYVKFVSIYYPNSYNTKLNPIFSNLINVFFSLENEINKIQFAEIISNVIELTKSKDEYVLQFWEYVFSNRIKLEYSKKKLPMYRYFIKSWLNKNSKVKYLEKVLNNDVLKDILINNDFLLHNEMSDKVNEYNNAS
jgi:hypothetical protein